MATSAYVAVAPPCPTCNGAMWDQKAGKFWGDGLTKNGKQKPRYECKNKDCKGAIWEPKVTVTKSGAEAVPAAGTVGGQTAAGATTSASPSAAPATERQKLTALYLDATTFVLDKIVPKFEEKEIGVSDTGIIAAIATIFIAASKER